MSLEIVKRPTKGVIARDGNKFLKLDDEPYGVKDKEVEGSDFKLIPRIGKERDVLYITGQSGSGKTYFTLEYLKEYKNVYKENPIYLFSAIENEGEGDPYNDKDLNVKRMKMTEDLKNIKSKDFYDSCVIFDDMDCYRNAKILKIVTELRDEMLETGRHNGITMIITYHLPCNGKDTRRLINEATSVTYFPRYSKPKIAYMMETYVGVSKEQLAAFRKLEGRSCTITTIGIPVVITKKKAFLLNKDESDVEDEED